MRSMSRLSSIINHSITGAEVKHGRVITRRKDMPASLYAGVRATGKKAKSPKWSPEEDQFLKDNLGWMTDTQIGASLGRSEIAVHLRWTRDLHLYSPSKAPDVITAQKAALALGIDGHKIAHWVDVGLITGRLMAGDRKIRLIQRVTFMRWACNPENWIYFNPKKVKDKPLRRLLKLKAQRWGDAWMTTRQAAKYHDVETKVILWQIKMGRLPGSVHLQVSLGGRHPNLGWSNWFVLRSEVTRLVIPHGSGRPGVSKSFTPAADRWILKARDKLGMEFRAIERTMKIERKKCGQVISARYHYLKRQQTNKSRGRRK